MRNGTERAVAALLVAERLASDLRQLVVLRERVALAEISGRTMKSQRRTRRSQRRARTRHLT
jgi:hypothetical protein